MGNYTPDNGAVWGGDGLAATTPNNDVLNTINGFTEQLTALGQGAANIYSTFIGARSTFELAKAQKMNNVKVNTVSPTNAVSALMQNKAVATGVIIATIATGYLIYKAVK